MAITDALTITGPGANRLTIDASGSDPTPDEKNGDGSRVFNITSGTAISGLTLTGGDATGLGGAIWAQADLVISDCTIRDNSILGGSAQGGGIGSSGGNLTVNRSTISGNSAADGDGGGIAIF